MGILSSYYLLRHSLQTFNNVPVLQTGGQLRYSLVCNDLDKVRQRYEKYQKDVQVFTLWKIRKIF